MNPRPPPPLTDDPLRALLWDSATLYVAEIAVDGRVLAANPAFETWARRPLVGEPFADVLTAPQRASFDERLALATEDDWLRLTLGFCDGSSGIAVDRVVRLRRIGGGRTLIVAEPAHAERDRLVEEVLALNDDLIATQRALARRQRELERAQAEARRAERRLAQLETITLTGLRSPSLSQALEELLDLAREALGSDRATILLRHELSGDLVVAAAVGLSDADRRTVRVPMGAGVAGSIAATGKGRLVPDLSRVEVVSPYLRGGGSLAGVPLVLEDEIIGVLHVSALETERFDAEDLALLERVGERVALAIGHAQLRDRERRIAEILQRSLLPERLPALPSVALAARYLPRARSVQVGGDFYDAVELPGGRLGLAIGDVAGKGLPAASTMGLLRSALRAYAVEDREPGPLLCALDRLLADTPTTMATALYARLDPASGALEFANAGHPPPLVLPSQEFLRDALSPPLGVMPHDRPGSSGVELSRGGTLILYTDGLVERRGVGLDDSFGRLAAAAATAPADADPEALADHLLEVLRPEGDDGFADDVALLIAQRRE